MGKITSIYLTDEEAEELKKFCNENQCSQYSALKTALRELFSSPIEKTENGVTQQNSEDVEVFEENSEAEEKRLSNRRKLLQYLEENKRE